MLSRSFVHASLFLVCCTAPLALASGCIIVADDTNTSGSGGSGGSGGRLTSTTTTSSGGGQGGAGGTSTAGNGGAGGTGGGASCVGPDGTGQTAASCDTMDITPSTAGGTAASNCDSMGGTGGTDPPPGYGLCLRGFEIYTAGSAENLRECLGQINGAPAFACDLVPITDCVNKMYTEACVNQAAMDTCQAVKDSLCINMEPFDVTGCSNDMKPFNAMALQQVADCITMSSQTDCQLAYNDCFDQISSF